MTASDGAWHDQGRVNWHRANWRHDLAVLRQLPLVTPPTMFVCGYPFTRFDGMIRADKLVKPNLIVGLSGKLSFLTEPLLALRWELQGCATTVSADTLPVRKPHRSRYDVCTSSDRLATKTVYMSICRDRSGPECRHENSDMQPQGYRETSYLSLQLASRLYGNITDPLILIMSYIRIFYHSMKSVL